jgi:hypothetical protein
MIHSDLIYNTPFGSAMKVLEGKYGYNDYVNLVFFLINEMGNPQSEWKAYLDLLPRKPASIAFKYWEKKAWIEDELLNVPILSIYC